MQSYTWSYALYKISVR